MAGAHEPMTFDDLSQLYRQELSSNSLTPVRRDLFKAVATLLTTLRKNYERLLAEDPESIICDGANQNFKNAENHWKKVVNTRAKKICAMAIRTAAGGDAPADILAEEEEEYCRQISERTKELFSLVNRMRGRKTKDTNLDADFSKPPVVKKEPELPPVSVREEMPPVVEMAEEEPFDETIPDPEDFPEMFPEPDPLKQEIGEKEEIPDAMKPVPIRVTEDLPEFAGPERTYRLVKEDVVMLPLSLAELLANDGKAIIIKPSW